MKIIRVSAFLDYGGIESKMVKLASLKDEHEWVFTAIGAGGDAECKIKELGKQCDCLNLSVKIPNLKTIIAFTEYIKKERPDVIHSSGAEANFYSFIAAKLTSTPKIICEEIGDFCHSPKARKIFRYIFQNSSFVLGESKFVTNKLLRVYKLDSSKVKIVPNFGLFNYDFSKLQKEGSDKFRILMVSRLEPVKNISGVLKSIQILKYKGVQDIELNILGSGSLKTYLEELSLELGISENVNFLGFQADPYPFLLNSELYILNSNSEGFSNSLIEAMYAGIPSISTKTGSAPEVITHNKNGFLIDVRDNEQLAIQIETAYQMDSPLLKKIGENGRLNIVNNYSIQTHTSSLFNIYK